MQYVCYSYVFLSFADRFQIAYQREGEKRAGEKVRQSSCEFLLWTLYFGEVKKKFPFFRIPTGNHISPRLQTSLFCSVGLHLPSTPPPPCPVLTPVSHRYSEKTDWMTECFYLIFIIMFVFFCKYILGVILCILNTKAIVFRNVVILPFH